MKSIGSIIAILFVASGCSHALHLSHIDDIQLTIHSRDAVRVKAEAEQQAIMGFVSETNYVNQAYTNLQDRCPNGIITGINTRYSTSHGFFSWTNKVRMTAWCTVQK